jgi:hypothetical protein
MPSLPGACVISGVNSVTHRKHAPRATWQTPTIVKVHDKRRTPPYQEHPC